MTDVFIINQAFTKKPNLPLYNTQRIAGKYENTAIVICKRHYITMLDKTVGG